MTSRSTWSAARPSMTTVPFSTAGPEETPLLSCALRPVVLYDSALPKEPCGAVAVTAYTPSGRALVAGRFNATQPPGFTDRVITYGPPPAPIAVNWNWIVWLPGAVGSAQPVMRLFHSFGPS